MEVLPSLITPQGSFDTTVLEGTRAGNLNGCRDSTGTFTGLRSEFKRKLRDVEIELLEVFVRTGLTFSKCECCKHIPMGCDCDKRICTGCKLPANYCKCSLTCKGCNWPVSGCNCKVVFNDDSMFCWDCGHVNTDCQCECSCVTECTGCKMSKLDCRCKFIEENELDEDDYCVDEETGRLELCWGVKRHTTYDCHVHKECGNCHAMKLTTCYSAKCKRSCSCYVKCIGCDRLQCICYTADSVTVSDTLESIHAMDVEVERRICGNIDIPTSQVLRFDWFLLPAIRLSNDFQIKADKNVIARHKYGISLVMWMVDFPHDVANIIIQYLSEDELNVDIGKYDTSSRKLQKIKAARVDARKLLW
jgi:hypothetical protein